MIMGETGDSGHGSGLDGRAKLRVIMNAILGNLGKGSQNREQG